MADATIKNIPRNPALGVIADWLISAKKTGGTIGDFFLQQSPEVIDNLSYGIMPFTGKGATFGAKPELLDLMNLTPLGSLAGAVGKPVAKMAGREIARQVETGTGILGRNVIDPRMNMIAYHGSPHSFDKFDMSKIGTGEGAQAYGHGLYFADSPDVAKSYAQIYEQAINAEKPTQQEYQELVKLKRKARQFGENMPQNEIEKLNQLSSKSLSYEQALKTIQDPSFYKVDIADEAIPNMLLWDKPLSEQPENVKKAIAPIIKEYGLPTSEEGRSLYSVVKELAGKRKGLSYGSSPSEFNALAPEASKYLNDLGITGIRYLDEVSRGQGAGTMNTVVFDDKLVKILEKNGKPIK